MKEWSWTIFESYQYLKICWNGYEWLFDDPKWSYNDVWSLLGIVEYLSWSSTIDADKCHIFSRDQKAQNLDQDMMCIKMRLIKIFLSIHRHLILLPSSWKPEADRELRQQHSWHTLNLCSNLKRMGGDGRVSHTTTSFVNNVEGQQTRINLPDRGYLEECPTLRHPSSLSIMLQSVIKRINLPDRGYLKECPTLRHPLSIARLLLFFMW